MSIDQLEDHILSEAYELFDEACCDLRVGKNLETVRARLVRLRQLTDQLARRPLRLGGPSPPASAQ